MATLSIQVSSGNLETYEALLLQLTEPPEVTGIDQLELSFGDVTQLFPSAFALMAAYVGRHRDPSKHALVLRRFGANPQSAKIERVMDAIGFLPAVAGRPLTPPKEKSGIFPLTTITPDTKPEELAQYLIDVICETAQPTRDAKETMFVIVSELCENVQRHAEHDSPAYVCAQLSAQKKKLELCFVDCGMGVKKSVETGKNRDLADRLEKGETALAIALEAGASSKSEGRTGGFGLFVVSEAARLTRGSFRLTSGNETILISREGDKYRTHAPWQGTVVNCQLNIDKLGSIAEAYRELPFPRGEDDRTIRVTGTRS